MLNCSDAIAAATVLLSVKCLVQHALAINLLLHSVTAHKGPSTYARDLYIYDNNTKMASNLAGMGHSPGLEVVHLAKPP